MNQDVSEKKYISSTMEALPSNKANGPSETSKTLWSSSPPPRRDRVRLRHRRNQLKVFQQSVESESLS
ncbi:hypothetical protein SAMN05444392_101251 [Seinonella peptonophila]|uniref:Uncharacterized protein n=1 Tax=Seinonella peptonophila TaxID=112248 RepID=A0A1M4T0Y2_9BACL|nr:hypothetical protein [Seinonella peptonophila]SHE38123.1 hypothetical protein SAMN05444392_101251 [Seinonella peptonophila]